MAARPYLNIDMSDVYEKLNQMKQVVGEKNAAKILYWTVKDSARHIRAKLSPILRKEYQTRAMTIRRSIGEAIMTGEMSCVIPIENARNIIGGDDFPLDGSTTRVVKGNATRRKKAIEAGKKPKPGKKYKIRAKILKKGVSTMPPVMPGAGIIGVEIAQCAARSLLLRHGRAWPGHPRLCRSRKSKTCWGGRPPTASDVPSLYLQASSRGAVHARD